MANFEVGKHYIEVEAEATVVVWTESGGYSVGLGRYVPTPLMDFLQDVGALKLEDIGDGTRP